MNLSAPRVAGGSSRGHSRSCSAEPLLQTNGRFRQHQLISSSAHQLIRSSAHHLISSSHDQLIRSPCPDATVTPSVTLSISCFISSSKPSHVFNCSKKYLC